MPKVLIFLILLWYSMPYLYALSDEDAALIAEGNVLGHAELEGVGLKGYFYDLKQTKDRQPTGLRGSLTNEQEVVKALRDYFKSDWSKKKLSKYYRSADAFYVPFIYMPPVSASYAPIAAGLGNPQAPESTWECRPSARLQGAIFFGSPRVGRSEIAACAAVRFEQKLK